MTQEELKKALANMQREYDKRGDRIEELEKACKEWAEVSQRNYQRAKAAEEALEEVSGIVLGASFAKTDYKEPWRYYKRGDKT